MDNPECKTEMLRIGELARTKDIYLVCFERVGNCHRFLLGDMINRAMIIEACRRMNQLVTERPDLVKESYATIAKALRLVACTGGSRYDGFWLERARRVFQVLLISLLLNQGRTEYKSSESIEKMNRKGRGYQEFLDSLWIG